MARFSHVINVIDSHTAGEPTRLVVSGLPVVRGATMGEKFAYAREHLNAYRRMLLLEPRGHSGMFGIILTAPCDPTCDYGLLFCDSGGWQTMCGHGTMGTAVSLVQMGMVPVRGSKTTVRFDTPAGLVEAHVHTDYAPYNRVSLAVVPSFSYASDLRLPVAGVGELDVSIAFGGNFFLVVPAEQVGLSIEPANSRRLVDLGLRILREANAAFPVRHPTQPHIDSIVLVEFTQPGRDGADYRNIVVFGDGNFDRSPCGTGTCARMAELHAQGKLALNQRFVHESVIGTRFEGKLVGETTVGQFPAVIPLVEGAAYITGLNSWVLDPGDPLRDGFLA